MNKADQNLCERVLSPGQEIGRLKFVPIKRNGALLLALPLNRSLALETLNLYQPQKIRGRILRGLLRGIVKCGLLKLSPQVEFKLGSQGLFSGLNDLNSGSELGFLLSGGDSQYRNLIGLCEVDGAKMVVKSGSDEAKDILIREYELQCKLAEEISGVPACKAYFKIDKGVAYLTEYVYGRSPKGSSGDAIALGLLNEWLSAGQLKSVNTLPDWTALKQSLSDDEMSYFAALGDLELISPAVHGDYAPWNMKIDSDGLIKVLDWEYSYQTGMPGWDWLHYNVQRLKLVDMQCADLIIAHCRRMMSHSVFADYLSKAGLNGNEEALLGSYLFYTGRYHSYPREEEIKIWLSTK